MRFSKSLALQFRADTLPPVRHSRATRIRRAGFARQRSSMAEQDGGPSCCGEVYAGDASISEPNIVPEYSESIRARALIVPVEPITTLG